ncbi:DUF6296 family protein [Kitasatospora sp. NPDC059571]|uniref:DUF6296 family protein n=1 Tax=Kitasatospora sp. NPDC059571 TaxID=3346871 RepID=UPI0036A0252C
MATTMRTTHYLVTLPGQVGCHAPQRRVEVRPTGEAGPHGHPLFADATGELVVEITPENMALPTGGAVLLHAHPVTGR